MGPRKLGSFGLGSRSLSDSESEEMLMMLAVGRDRVGL